MIIAAKTIITGDGKTVITDGGLLMQGDKIAAVGPVAELRKAHPAEEYVDYGVATILPGLIDMHIHLGFYAGRADEALYTEHLIAYLAQNNAWRMLKAGVTTVRDAYSPNAVCRQLALAAKKGWLRAPRIIHCNQALTISGGFDSQIDGTVQADGPEGITKAVREQIREGAQWIKAMTSWRTPGVAEFTQEELDAMVYESHRRGHKAMAHATLHPSMQMCIDAGFDTIEHGTNLTLEQARQMSDKGIAWVPTICVHKTIYNNLVAKMGPERDENRLTERERQTYTLYGESMTAYAQNLRPLYDTGALMLAGTDCPFDGMEDITVATELDCMVECGLTPLEAIATATANSARVLGLEGQIGELRKDALADILVVAGDASQDISALMQVKEVYQAGTRICRG